jgi:hypothetical protein
VIFGIQRLTNYYYDASAGGFNGSGTGTGTGGTAEADADD